MFAASKALAASPRCPTLPALLAVTSYWLWGLPCMPMPPPSPSSPGLLTSAAVAAASACARLEWRPLAPAAAEAGRRGMAAAGSMKPARPALPAAASTALTPSCRGVMGLAAGMVPVMGLAPGPGMPLSMQGLTERARTQASASASSRSNLSAAAVCSLPAGLARGGAACVPHRSRARCRAVGSAAEDGRAPCAQKQQTKNPSDTRPCAGTVCTSEA